jgi:hypothetical protein
VVFLHLSTQVAGLCQMFKIQLFIIFFPNIRCIVILLNGNNYGIGWYLSLCDDL